MKLLRFSFLLFTLAILAVGVSAQRVFVIPIETEIDQSAFHHFRQGEREALESGANLLLVKLNTYGGALDAADSIRTALLRCPLPTLAYVDVNAASAGALIALACDSVYMAPAASMGSATVVNGAGEPMPEKYQSYMSTIMRATAEHHGRKSVGDSLVWRRDPAIAASMVNPDVSVSLTASQAVECGYADGIAPNLGAVLADIDMAGAEVSYYQSTLTDDIMGFLANAAVRAILVMLILGGIYMEMHTPSLGFAAAVSAVATVLYFLPMFVTGSMPAWVLLCFIVGVALIALEIFVVPGFGVTGISGIIAVVMALVGGMLTNDAVTGFDFSSLCNSLIIVGVGSLLAVGAIVYLTSSHGPKVFRKHTELMTELRVDDGFVGVDMSPVRYIGQIGETVTDMRPAGKIEIGNTVFDAVSTGPFIAAKKQVKVTKYENAQLYVSEV